MPGMLLSVPHPTINAYEIGISG